MTLTFTLLSAISYATQMQPSHSSCIRLMTEVSGINAGVTDRLALCEYSKHLSACKDAAANIFTIEMMKVRAANNIKTQGEYIYCAKYFHTLAIG